ncbi:hypothetical protein BDV93DRAFT_566545 [Ceratobasidium sp. AG-I]|nr:hypothetical protein BDV93DRAFT_566545 [Ceratobasidium sp. AG-I]
MGRGKRKQDQTVEVPEREMVINRANAKQVANGQPIVLPPTLASTRVRRKGTDKAYSATSPPRTVVRRVPVKPIPVPRLPGQEDIPSSPISAFRSQGAPGPSHNYTPIGSTELESDNAGGESTNTDEMEASHPFGGSNDTFEPHRQALPPLEDSHILPPSTLQSNSENFNGWNSFGSMDLQNRGEFGSWMNNYDPQSSFAAPQSLFAAPYSASVTPQFNLAAPLPDFASSHSNASTHLSSPFTGLHASSTQLSDGQQPIPTASFLDNLQPHRSGLPAPNICVSPINESHPSTSSAGLVATSEPVAVTFPSQEPISTPIRNSTMASRSRLRVSNSSKKISSKTPQRKYMKANVAAHYAVQRKHRQRQTQGRQQTPHATTTGDDPQAPQNPQLDGLTTNQQAVIMPMRKYIGFHILTRTAWPIEQAPLLDDALSYAKAVPGNESIGTVDFTNPFTRQLKLKESALRGEFTGHIMSFVQDYYEISPSTRTRIDSLIENDRFLYPNETITPCTKPGFVGARCLLRAVGIFLFQHPHNLGTLFIEELCAEDPPKKWHAKAADKTATNGAPVGLLAFAGVAVLHCLECIRDRPPTGKKAYKFEHARYSHIWLRYRKELIKYKHLGELRRTYLAYIKRRYNEMNRTSKDRADDSDIEDDEDNAASDVSSDYASDEPAEGAMYEDRDEGLDED